MHYRVTHNGGSFVTGPIESRDQAIATAEKLHATDEEHRARYGGAHFTHYGVVAIEQIYTTQKLGEILAEHPAVAAAKS